jgi:hypothetical protein
MQKCYIEIWLLFFLFLKSGNEDKYAGQTIELLQVLFSSYIQKTNRFNKCADRALLITDSNIYKLETKKFKAMKKGSPIQEV